MFFGQSLGWAPVPLFPLTPLDTGKSVTYTDMCYILASLEWCCPLYLLLSKVCPMCFIFLKCLVIPSFSPSVCQNLTHHWRHKSNAALVINLPFLCTANCIFCFRALISAWVELQFTACFPRCTLKERTLFHSPFVGLQCLELEVG